MYVIIISLFLFFCIIKFLFQIYEHSCGEIWSLVASPIDKRLITTCYTSIERDCNKFTNLWRLPDSDGHLENVTTFPTEKYGTDVKV